MSEAESSSPRRPMLLVSERVEPDASIAPTATTETTPREAPEAVSQYRSWRAGAMGTINVLAAVLAVRAILLVAVAGAIALAWLAAAEHDPYRLAALGAYTVTVVLPLVWLAGRR